MGSYGETRPKSSTAARRKRLGVRLILRGRPRYRDAKRGELDRYLQSHKRSHALYLFVENINLFCMPHGLRFVHV
jgi:hypothetical protein